MADSKNEERVRAFAEAWPDRAIVQRVLHKVPWGQNLEVLRKLDDETTRICNLHGQIMVTTVESQHTRRASVARHAISRRVFLCLRVDTGGARMKYAKPPQGALLHERGSSDSALATPRLRQVLPAHGLLEPRPGREADDPPPRKLARLAWTFRCRQSPRVCGADDLQLLHAADCSGKPLGATTTGAAREVPEDAAREQGIPSRLAAMSDLEECRMTCLVSVGFEDQAGTRLLDQVHRKICDEDADVAGFYTSVELTDVKAGQYVLTRGGVRGGLEAIQANLRRVER